MANLNKTTVYSLELTPEELAVVFMALGACSVQGVPLYARILEETRLSTAQIPQAHSNGVPLITEEQITALAKTLS